MESIEVRFRRILDQTSNSTPGRHGGNASSKEHVKCFGCHEFGHFRGDAECPAEATRDESRYNRRRGKRPNGNVSKVVLSIHRFTTAQATGLKDPSLSNRWVVDSGATDHFKASGEGVSFTSHKKVKVGMANSNISKSSGSGTYELNEFTTLSNVIVLPDLRFNLLSVAKCTKAGVDVHFTKDKCLFEQDGRVLVSATKKNGLFIVDEEAHPHANTPKEDHPHASPCECDITRPAKVVACTVWSRRPLHRMSLN